MLFRSSAFTYEKADYFKIKDITLSYNVPAKWLHTIGMNKARVYCSMKNFMTWSKIDNYDPERGGSISFPMQQQVVIGLNVEFYKHRINYENTDIIHGSGIFYDVGTYLLF